MKKRFVMGLAALFVAVVTVGTSIADESLRLVQVKEDIYAIVGPLGNRSAENLGNNSTSAFVVTNEGVVLIDSGGSYKGAKALHAMIRQVTDKPIKRVINTGGQDHRWLGNGYFKTQGVKIIASEAAVSDQQERLQDQMFMLGNLVGMDGLEGTEAVYADEFFNGVMTFEFGGKRFVARQVAHAHTPGDVFVWMPDESVVFAGDIVFVDRLLGVQEYSNSKGWIEAFDAMAELKPGVIVPGHGRPVALEQAREQTRDYLSMLRKAVAELMDTGGGITEVGTLDQSAYAHLESYEMLKGRNAQQIYQEMEWE